MSNLFYYIYFASAIALVSGLKLSDTRNEKVITETKNLDNADYLLPKTIVPLNYDIFLKVDLEKFKFYGTVNMNIQVLEKTGHIMLHSKNLKITRVVLKDYDIEEIIQTGTVNFDRKRDLLTIPTRENLIPRTYNLSIKYIGSLEEELNGFYRNSYPNAEGEKM